MTQTPRGFHPLIRGLHWINAGCTLGLIFSGWTIYEASPFYPVSFPPALRLGGYLTEGIRWHFAFAWGFVICSSLLIVLRGLARVGGPAVWPVSPKRVLAEAGQALRLRLGHRPGVYIHIQRLLYLALFALCGLAVLSGLALWKSVQLQGLADLLGGYEAARRWHFWAMAGIAGFTCVHLVMVAIVPSTLLAMLFGAKPTPASKEDSA